MAKGKGKKNKSKVSGFIFWLILGMFAGLAIGRPEMGLLLGAAIGLFASYRGYAPHRAETSHQPYDNTPLGTHSTNTYDNDVNRYGDHDDNGSDDGGWDAGGDSGDSGGGDD